MMMPSILGENLFDDFMNDFRLPAFPDVDKELYGKHAKNLMKTDVKETEKGYEVDMDLPGFKKDEIQMELNDGVLTISAAKGLDKDEEDKKGNYIRKERYAGSMSRSFYVGKYVTVGCTSEIRERNPLLQCSERGSKTSGRKEKLYFH